jgi:predicted O-methyltransferase YrrM
MYKFGLWQREGEMAAEREVGELLYGLVRLIKPINVIETGSANGSTAFQIGLALKANGQGLLQTCDTDEACVARTSFRCAKLPVQVHQSKGIELIEKLWDETIDFAFVDSWWNDVRTEELLKLASKIKPRRFLALHDANHNYKPSYERFTEQNPWQNVVFHSPLGLSLWQKPGEWPQQEPIPPLEEIA